MIKIIGLGNEYRGDDYIGLAIARKIKNILGENSKIEVKEVSDPSRLLNIIEKEDEVIIIDSAKSGAAPGTMWRFEIIPGEELLEHTFSTHTIPLQKILELLRFSDNAPRKIIIYAVEGKEFGEGKGLTEKVESAVDRVSESILNYLKKTSSNAFKG